MLLGLLVALVQLWPLIPCEWVNYCVLCFAVLCLQRAELNCCVLCCACSWPDTPQCSQHRNVDTASTVPFVSAAECSSAMLWPQNPSSSPLVTGCASAVCFYLCAKFMD